MVRGGEIVGNVGKLVVMKFLAVVKIGIFRGIIKGKRSFFFLI